MVVGNCPNVESGTSSHLVRLRCVHWRWSSCLLFQIGYYLDEDNSWALDLNVVEEQLDKSRSFSDPRCMVVINPGNPTGMAPNCFSIFTCLPLLRSLLRFTFSFQTVIDQHVLATCWAWQASQQVCLLMESWSSLTWCFRIAPCWACVVFGSVSASAHKKKRTVRHGTTVLRSA